VPHPPQLCVPSYVETGPLVHAASPHGVVGGRDQPVRQLHCGTHRMLTNQLRKREADGLVHRKIYPEEPPTVEYSLTRRGMTL